MGYLSGLTYLPNPQTFFLSDFIFWTKKQIQLFGGFAFFFT
jgi:hypothetical protein